MEGTLAYFLIVLPIAFAAIVGFSPAPMAKWIGTIGAFATLAVALLFAWTFPHWTDGLYAPDIDAANWFPAMGVSIALGADSVALLLILMTAFLMPLILIGSFTSITERPKDFFFWFMLLEASMLGAFLARDAVIFFVSYEFTMIPMFFLIANWGGAQRRQAAVKYVLYSFGGGILTLVGLLYIAMKMHAALGSWDFGIASMTAFCSTEMLASEQVWVFILLMAGFAVKIPLVPFHTWLPLVHDQAPTGGSVILAGTLLKLGTFGEFRIAMPMAPIGAVEWNGVLCVLCLIGIVAAALICWVQHDAKKLVAYSSVTHIAFCMLGMFSLNSIGVTGSVMYMISHGLSTGALFLCIGMIYERYHTKDMDELGGLYRTMPIWSFFMVFFTLASLGLPGLNGFVGEFYCLVGAFTAEDTAMTGYPGLMGPWYAIIAGLGLIAAAMYLLMLVGRLVWGPLREPGHHDAHHAHGHAHGQAHAQARDHAHDHAHGAHATTNDRATTLSRDIGAREIGILVPIAILCLVLGLYPEPMLKAIEPSVKNMLAPYPALVERYLKAGTLLESGSEAPPMASASQP
ncbi:MAG: NADH-quinone oxidoreductase subunit M [Phycisphaerales bacterium]|nr:NADH-quinone oxidoreductase subunit M [Phycisphaerales bacterium]